MKQNKYKQQSMFFVLQHYTNGKLVTNYFLIPVLKFVTFKQSEEPVMQSTNLYTNEQVH